MPFHAWQVVVDSNAVPPGMWLSRHLLCTCCSKRANTSTHAVSVAAPCRVEELSTMLSQQHDVAAELRRNLEAEAALHTQKVSCNYTKVCTVSPCAGCARPNALKSVKQPRSW